MRRQSRSYWKRLIDEFEESGLSQVRFAEERRVQVATLRYWVYRFRRELTPALVPVRVVASTAPLARQGGVAAMTIEAELPSGLRLRIPTGADAEYVADLIRRLA
jgi:hypothetical protein